MADPTTPATPRPDAVGRPAPRLLAVGAGLALAVLVGAAGGHVAAGGTLPPPTVLAALAALALGAGVVAARTTARRAARAVAVAGLTLVAVVLQPVLVVLAADVPTIAPPTGHAAHAAAAAPASDADAPAADAAGEQAAPEPGSWDAHVAAVDLAALAAAVPDVTALHDAGWDEAALTDAGLDDAALTAAGLDPADEHARHYVAAALAAAPADPAAAEAVTDATAAAGERATTGVVALPAPALRAVAGTTTLLLALGVLALAARGRPHRPVFLTPQARGAAPGTTQPAGG